MTEPRKARTVTRIGSLFSGAGGLDLAVEAVLGGRTVWHSELDPAASKVLAHRWPNVPNLGDITAVDWDQVEPVDVLCGGFPCQDVSAAGKRAGLAEGTRSGLWTTFADAIDVLRPRLVIIENVRGLLSAKAHRAMESRETTLGDGSGGPVLRAAGAVCGDLADLGYDAQWITLAASAVGAPHKRERVFIVAHPAGQPWRVNDGDQLRAGRGAQRPGPATGAGSDAHTARDGRHEGRPESARIVGGSDASLSGDRPVALLPTPDAWAGSRGSQARATRLSGKHQTTIADLPQLIEDALLPTPNAQDGNGGGRYNSEGHQSTLPGEVRLLPTPTAGDVGGHTSRSGDRINEPLLGGIVQQHARGDLLPTPNASDGNGGKTRSREALERGDHQVNLTDLPRLLPTPSASDGNRGPDYARRNRDGSGADDLVTIATEKTNAGQWGRYASAIHRWETVVGPAPAPTEPNRNGNPRLAAAFSEWMMGWPAGWVTDPAIGITRNDQLRIIGNGVVPQQAVAALRWLLRVAEVAA